MEQKQVYKGALSTMVKIIDWTSINKAISDKIGEQVECRLGKGLIENVEAIFNKELGYEEIKSLPKLTGELEKDRVIFEGAVRNFFMKPESITRQSLISYGIHLKNLF